MFLVIGAFFLFGGVNAIVSGKFHSGGMRGMTGMEVLRTDEPFQFWIGVGVCLLLGIIALWTALRKK